MKTVLKKIIIGLFALILCLCAVSCGDKDDYVPAGFKRASDENADYILYVPDSWDVDMTTGVTTAKVSETDSSNISFIGFELDDAIVNVETQAGTAEGDEAKADTLDRFWEYYSAEFSKTFSDMAYDEGENGANMIVSKQAAKRYTYSATVTGVEYKFMQIVVIKDGSVFILTYTAQKDVFDTHKNDVLEIAKYIELK